jgi:hypothetical protein
LENNLKIIFLLAQFFLGKTIEKLIDLLLSAGSARE